MPLDCLDHLVAATFAGFHFKYHILLGWARYIPLEYDGVDLAHPDDVRRDEALAREVGGGGTRPPTC